jgi:hypothetical protein
MFPNRQADFISDEKQAIASALRSGELGVVTIEPPFALAKRGHPTDLNDKLMNDW